MDTTSDRRIQHRNPQHLRDSRRKLSAFRARFCAAFTLVEMLVALGIASMLLVMVWAVVRNTVQLTQSARSRMRAEQQVQLAFGSLSRALADAGMSSWSDYVLDTNALSASAPMGILRAVRRSSHHFLCGPAAWVLGPDASAGGGSGASVDPAALHPGHAVFFQAPPAFGRTPEVTRLGGLASPTGYFVEFGTNAVPGFVSAAPRYRYRLFQFLQPAEDSIVGMPYSISGATQSFDWLRFPLSRPAPPARPAYAIAENVIALVALPRMPRQQDPAGALLAPVYRYDSRKNFAFATPMGPDSTLHRLPPVVDLALVILEEPSAIRLEAEYGTRPPELGLANLFTNAARFDADIKTLETSLTQKNLRFHILRADVLLRGAR